MKGKAGLTVPYLHSYPHPHPKLTPMVNLKAFGRFLVSKSDDVGNPQDES